MGFLDGILGRTEYALTDDADYSFRDATQLSFMF